MAFLGRPGGSPASIVAESPASYSGKDGQPPIPEHLLARLWQKRASRQQWFRTDRGQRVRVLYPGRPGKAAGPDFRNALLEVEGVGLVQGDVEIHRRQRDWDSHGHSDDPNYSSVVLHAALETDSSATRVPSGQPVPVISLAPLLEQEERDGASPGPALWGLLGALGYPRPASATELGALLDRAGDQRFLGKSRRFQKFLQEQDREQALYEALLEALGYRHNQQPFLTLATRCPYRVLAAAARALPDESRAEALESWLLKQSGLLGEDEANCMPLPRTGLGHPMSGREWRCFRVRPANHPRRRIAGAARLLSRFLGTGLVNGLSAAAETRRPKELTIALTVGGGPGGGTAGIGAARAGELAVNVVLPFLHGLAMLDGDDDLARQRLELYHQFGKPPENEITREMAHQLLEASWTKEVVTARRQQGLIHLQRLLAGAAS